jgi:hypothetical protein
VSCRLAVEIGGLKVSTHRLGFTGGLWRMAQDGVGITGARSVMHYTGPVEVTPAVEKRMADPRVQVAGVPGFQRVLPRLSRQLVTERDQAISGLKHARVAALGNRYAIAEHSIDQPGFGPAGHDRNQVENATGAIVEPARAGKDRIPDGCGDTGAIAGKHFGDEERVAVGRLVETRIGTIGRPCESAHRLR